MSHVIWSAMECMGAVSCFVPCYRRIELSLAQMKTPREPTLDFTARHSLLFPFLLQRVLPPLDTAVKR